MHISKFSGSVIESTLMGVPTLVLEEIGNQSFEELIVEGKVIGLAQPDADQITNQLTVMVQSNRDESLLTNFSPCLDELTKV